MLSIGLSFLCIMAACNSKKQVPDPVEGPSSELSAIDSLMWSQPDSALLRLLPWFDTCCRDAARHISTATAYNRHYANLLLSELLYKNDYPQTNRTELQQALAYLDSVTMLADTHGVSLQPRPRRDARRAFAQNIAFLDARAHYINGVGYYEHDSVVEACKEYMKALEVMEERFEEKELVGYKARFMALTYTRLTVLFSDRYLHDPAIYFGKNSLHYYKKSNDSSWHLAWMLSEIGTQYDIMDIIDSATYYYEKGLNLLSGSDNLTYRDLSTHLTYLSFKKGESSELSLNLLHQLIDMAESNKEYCSRCLTIGEIFYHETQFDSAWHYYELVYNNTQSEESKKLAAERLAEISKIIGYDSKSSEYASYLAQFATISERQSTLNSVLVELYRHYSQSKENHLHAQRIRQNAKPVIWLICFLVVLIGLSIVINMTIRNNNKRLKEEKQKTEELLVTENYSHRIKQAALSSKLKKSNEALRDTLKQLENNISDKKTPNPSIHTKDYISFMETPICQLILKTVRNQGFKSKMNCIVYKEHALQKEQLLALRLAADEKMDSFTVRIRKQFPSLTDDDVIYCCFYLLGLNEADISALMQKAYPTVCERKRKIRRIIDEKNDLTFVLRNLS